MKKSLFLSFLLCLALFTLLSCGSTNHKQNSSTPENDTQVPLPAESATETPSSTENEHVHRWGAWYVDAAATCEKTGVESRSCTCGAIDQKSLPMLDHTYANGVCAHCGRSQNGGDLEYIKKGDVYWVSGIGACTDTVINIPNEYKGIKVVGIESDAFRYNKNITDVLIAEGITTIGTDAFDRCQALTVVRLPSTVETIDYQVFSNCKALREVHLSGALKTIGIRAFNNCVNLEIINLPSHMESIGAHAFENCEKLKIEYIPEGITELPSSVFRNCRSLEHITFPSTLKTIADLAFSNCRSLKTVQFRSSDIIFKEYAFNGCLKLTIDSLWTDVGNVGRGAFSYVTIHELTVTGEILSEAFIGANVGTLTLCEGFTTIGKDALYSTHIDTLILPHSLTLVEAGAFYFCTLKDLVFRSPVTLGYLCFNNYKDLQTLTLPSGTDVKNRNAFEDCVNLKTIYFGGTEEEWEPIRLNHFLPSGCTVMYNTPCE